MKTSKLTKILSGSFFFRFCRIRPFRNALLILALLWLVICSTGAGRLYATCIALDDLPLDVEQQQAPGIVAFLVDNSGSMDWEVLCAANEQGIYLSGGTSYGYVFSDPGDNAFDSSQTYGDTVEDNIPTQWKSQWYGYNYMYYNPAAKYLPWPTYSNADLDNPRSNPVNSTPTLSMSHVFYDFGEPPISTDALSNAGAIFVDNLDTAASQGLAPTIYMDTQSAVNDVMWSGANYGSCSLTTNGPAWSSTTGSTAYPNGDSSDPYTLSDQTYYYSPTGTTARSKTFTATWTFTNIVTGSYDVYAWWVASTSNTSTAVYKINGTTVVSWSQRTNGGKWNLLAANQTLTSGDTVSVSQTNASSGTLYRLCADAVKIVPKFNALPPILFEKTGPTSQSNNGWVLNTDAAAYKRPQDSSPGTYYYTCPPCVTPYPTTTGTFTATWTANNLTAGQAYDVWAVWAQGGTNRSSSVPYTTYYGTNFGSSTTTNVNQQQTLGYWTKIGSSLTCTDGRAKVVLTRTTTDSSYNTGRACADAVAFVPAGTLSVKIHRSHYYVQKPDPVTPTTTNTYLVDFDGGTINYYKYVDDGDNLIESNEITKLTLAQATNAGIVTGRTYTQERQNFANWYSYYRRRILTAKNAISNVINTMQGVYIGIFTINNDIKQIAVPVRVTIDNVTQDQSATLLTALFNVNASGSTPLRTALNNVGNYFKGAYAKPATMPSAYFASNTYPYFIFDKGGSCQQSFAIVMTDGYWNDSYSNSTIGDADTTLSATQKSFADGTRPDGGKYADSVTSTLTLADIAMYYYENDLNSTLNNYVPTIAADPASWQHMVTYTLSFGLTGSIDRSAYPTCPTGTCPTWPTPVSNDPKTVDDLWHAAVDGRGKYINASNPMDLVDAMNALKEDIESRLGSAASMATSAIERQVGTMVYQGTYNTAGWFGEIKALPINVETGAVETTPNWLASEHVPVWNLRNILSHDGSHGIKFEFANISSEQEAQLGATYGYDVAQVVDFIRGDTSHNQSHGGDLRTRTKVLGDFVHSTPCFYDNMLYVGGNDGMLHAIDATNGHEIFCYVPAKVYDHLEELAYPSYSHKYYVDGSPTVGKAANNHDILVCGLGKGGKGYFALDVTNPDAMTEDNVLWEAPAATDNDMGYAFSNPIIVNTQAAGKVVVFGNGYDSVNQKAVLYILNLTSGATIAKIDTGVAGCNGLSTPSIIDMSGVGYVDYAFAGDLLGNIWKFDLRGNSTSSWKVYYWETTTNTPKPLISVKNGSNVAQTIMDAPEIMFDCATSAFASSGQGLMVIFGTGRYLNGNDLGNKDTQSLYGIWDWGNIWEKRSSYDVAKTKYLGATSGTTRDLSNVSGKTLLQQTSTLNAAGDAATFSSNTVQWYNPLAASGSQGQHMGWFYDLPGSGERVIQDPYLRKGVAIFVSLVPSSSPCEAGGSSWIYMINACNGGHTVENQFLNRTDHVDKVKDPRILFKPIEISNILYFSNSEGGASSMSVPHIVVGAQYWRTLQ